jgi:hypothetical protein
MTDEYWEERETDEERAKEERYLETVHGEYLIKRLGREACNQRVWRQKGLTAEDMFEMLASSDPNGTDYRALYWNE